MDTRGKTQVSGGWDAYPDTYRQAEVQQILRAVQAGECVSVVGLSGAGKSNLAGFLAHRGEEHRFVLVDGNRLPDPSAFWTLVLEALAPMLGTAAPNTAPGAAAFSTVLAAVGAAMQTSPSLILVFDRFDVAASAPEFPFLASNLRALRDAFKYRLAYVFMTRQPLDPSTELAELTAAHTLWLGPLAWADARWSAGEYARRRGLDWTEATLAALVELSWGYPSFLRAACEALAASPADEISEILAAGLRPLEGYPAVQARIAEFWSDAPAVEMLQRSGLAKTPSPPSPLPVRGKGEGGDAILVHPWLRGGLVKLGRTDLPPWPPSLNGKGEEGGEKETSERVLSLLTAQEFRLYEALRSKPGEVWNKDDLIQAVWPEDVIFEQGIRDDSLAQLVRRLRKKIEPDPSQPALIQTVPGRGYIWRREERRE